MSTNPFATATTWASGWIVVPGKGDTKTPFQKFAMYSDRRPTSKELAFWALRGECGAQPLLLLDVPERGRSLCVVDIDDPAKLADVESWLTKWNLAAARIPRVQTGRAGGGTHLYLRRQDGCEALYRSRNGALGGGVDAKAWHSYVVAPNAVHKTGKVYTATLDGAPITTLGDVFAGIPICPLAAWQELTGQRTADGATVPMTLSVPVDRLDAEWAHVVSNGADRQPCPWCQRGDTRVLAYDSGTRTAHCFFEQVTRRQAIDVVEIDKAVDSALVQPTPAAREPEPLSDLGRADQLVYQYEDERAGESSTLTSGPPSEDELYTGIMEEISSPVSEKTATPLIRRDYKVVAVFSESEVEQGMDLLGRRRTPACERGGFVHTPKGGLLHTRQVPCLAYRCPACGPRLKNTLRAAAVVCVQNLVHRESFSALAISNLSSSTRRQLARWKDGKEGVYYITIATTPGSSETLLLWDAEHPPGAVLLRHLLADGATYVSTEALEAHVGTMVETIDVSAWNETRATILRGDNPRMARGDARDGFSLVAKVSALRDALLGRSEAEALKTGVENPDEPTKSVHTFTALHVAKRAMEDIVQGRMVTTEEEEPRKGGVLHVSKFADHEIPVAPVLQKAVENGSIKVTVRKPKRKPVAGFYDLGLEDL